MKLIEKIPVMAEVLKQILQDKVFKLQYYLSIFDENCHK